MRVGLIARADNTGLGIQSKEFYDHIPCKALVIDMTAMAPGLQMLKPHLDRYPDCKVFKITPGRNHTMNRIPDQVIDEFISDIDILFAMETPYDMNVFSKCRERGVKTILQLNYEFLEYPSHLPMPDLLAAPSMWNFESIPHPKIFLPVPVNLDKFGASVLVKNTFVHIIGRPAAHDRNGTQLFFKALDLVKSKINVQVKSQQPIRVTVSNPNVTMSVDISNKDNYQDNYPGGILVLPRRYGGLSLPINEAIAACMPVITTDISPNNTWLPPEWLVPAVHQGSFQCKKRIDYYAADVQKLADKIDEMADQEVYFNAVAKASELRNAISWQSLTPLYSQAFKELLS